jgi:hypothetical protein
VKRAIYLVLEDTVEQYVDDFGEMRSRDKLETESASRKILDSLEGLYGSPEKSRKDKTPLKLRSPFNRDRASHSFGGHEVVAWTQQIAFAIGAGGGLTGLYGLAKEWIRLKSGRKVRFETLDKDGSRKVTADISGFSEDQLKRILDDGLQTLAEKPRSESQIGTSGKAKRKKATKTRAGSKRVRKKKAVKTKKTRQTKRGKKGRKT